MQSDLLDEPQAYTTAWYERRYAQEAARWRDRQQALKDLGSGITGLLLIALVVSESVLFLKTGTWLGISISDSLMMGGSLRPQPQHTTWLGADIVMNFAVHRLPVVFIVAASLPFTRLANNWLSAAFVVLV